MLTIYRSEEEAGLCLYDSFEDFARAWKADEYEPECTFCLAPENVEVMAVIQEEQRSNDEDAMMDRKSGEIDG